MAKRIAVLTGAAAFALIAGVLAIWLYIGRAGSSELENWIGRQVVGILQNHLTPEVSFQSLDYQAPRTVVVDNLTFTAETHPILHVARARLELAEIPQRGRPILIQHIDLDTPKLQFITGKTGELVGWSKFVKTDAIKHPETVPPGQRLSDVLILRHVGIQEGEVVYQDRAHGATTMTLPGINLQLDTPPIENEPGWHRLVGQLKRDPLIDLRLQGRINLDTGLLDVAALQLAASLGEQQYRTLPPALQDFLRRHEIKGALTASGKGQLPLKDPSRFAGTVRAELRDARLRHNGTVLPVRAITVDARLPEGGIDISAGGVNLAGDEGAGEPLPFFSVKSIAARLAGIPAKDQPLVIESVQVDQPHVVFAARPQGGLTGWSQLAKKARPKPGDGPEKANVDASDILRAVHLRQFGIKGGAVTYRPAAGQPLTLDGIEVALTGRPQAGSPDVLDVNGTVQAGPLVKADLKGRLDTRAALLDIETFESVSDVGPNNYELFPPGARDWVKQHEVQGTIAVTARGAIPLGKEGQPKLAGTAEVTSAHARFNGVSVPLGQARVQFKFPERRIEATVADVKLVSNDLPSLTVPALTATVTLPLDGPIDVRTDIKSASLLYKGLRVPIGQTQGQFGLTGGPFSISAHDVAIMQGENALAKAAGIELHAPAPPWAAGPTRFDRLRIDQPTFNIVQQPDGTLMGWNQPGKSSEASHPQKTDANPSGIDLDRLEIKNANINYTGPKTRGPLVLQGLDAVLQTRRDAQTGRLQFSGQVRRPDMLSIDFEGRYDANQPALTFSKLLAKAAITQASLSSLPPPMQDSITRHQLEGEVTASWKGSIPLGNSGQLAGHIELTATGARVPYANAVWPVNKLQVKGDLPDGPIAATAEGLAIKAGDLQFFSAAALDLRVRQLAGQARPMKIDSLTLQDPRVVLISGENGFAGWSGLAQNEKSGKGQGPAPILGQLRVNNGELVYASAGGHEMMALPGINITADLEPGPQSQWYRLAGQIRRGDFLNMDLKGRLNSTDQLLDLASLNLRAQLTGQDNKALPPSVQELVRDHQLRGTFTVEAQGRIPLKHPEQLQGRLSATARDAMFSYEQTQWPVQQLDVNADANRGVISGRLNASMLGGRVQANGQASLPQNGTFQLDWQASDVQLEKMMRAVERGGTESSYAGILAGKGQIRGRLADLPESLSGPGELTVEKGQLLNLPLIRNIVVSLITAPLGLNVNRTDRANVTWQFRNAGVQIQRMAVTSPLITLEGRGDLSYDGQVNMRFTVQPAQSAGRLAQKLPGPLGRIGNVIQDVGKLGGQIITYEVTGDISNPRVVPAPLGITGK